MRTSSSQDSIICLQLSTESSKSRILYIWFQKVAEEHAIVCCVAGREGNAPHAEGAFLDDVGLLQLGVESTPGQR